ncbi:unnamed protein product [Bursaphelenchus xylophilus]|uniref:(pine wood nematode) hypothetical protein n=1 Tax=Bursaphelenchus xylophilus TaxID=6326 RepID=A0A7I8WG52_BURXY|nr:unnamed protein product [Bursaphelenchus xylophilus]CAG9111487.1 unnamed protein product [Bursaphelenchus xylophilus]
MPANIMPAKADSARREPAPQMGMRKCWSRKYFAELPDHRWGCVFCGHAYVCSTTKFKHHLKRCHLMPPDVRQIVYKLIAEKEQASLFNAIKRPYSEAHSGDEEIESKFSRNGSYLDSRNGSYMDTASTSGINQSIMQLLDQHNNEKSNDPEEEGDLEGSNGQIPTPIIRSRVENERLDYLMRMFVVSTNSSPEVLENKYLKEFVQTLCPSYQLPSPQEFREHVEEERNHLLNYCQTHISTPPTENQIVNEIHNPNENQTPEQQ